MRVICLHVAFDVCLAQDDCAVAYQGLEIALHVLKYLQKITPCHVTAMSVVYKASWRWSQHSCRKHPGKGGLSVKDGYLLHICRGGHLHFHRKTPDDNVHQTKGHRSNQIEIVLVLEYIEQADNAWVIQLPQQLDFP